MSYLPELVYLGSICMALQPANVCCYIIRCKQWALLASVCIYKIDGPWETTIVGYVIFIVLLTSISNTLPYALTNAK